MDEELENLFQKACELTKNNEAVKAIPLFEKADEQGHVEASAWLSCIYLQGRGGVDINYEKGLPYLEKSVNIGHPYSINLLGTLYYDGKGLPQDYEQAFISFSIAAKKGEPYALLNLASCYEEGNGTEKNIDKALKCYFKIIDGQYDEDLKKDAYKELEKYNDNPDALYYLANQYNYEMTPGDSLPDFEKIIPLKLRAAELGNVDAQYEIGKFYESGLGVEENIEEAKKWLEKAADKGHPGAIYSLQYMTDPDFSKKYKARTEEENAKIRDDLIHAHELYYIDHNYEEAIKWYEKAAEKNNTDAQYYIGKMYYEGKGVPADYGKAFEWCEKSAMWRNPNALFLLGEMYFNGKGVNQDYQKAFESYEKAAKLDNIDAQVELGEMYFGGKGIKQDYKKAFEWCKKTRNLSNVSRYNLGFMFEYGKGTEQDYYKAFEMYKKAAECGNKKAVEWFIDKAENGDLDAQYQLANLYKYGYGTKVDEVKAKELYEKVFPSYKKAATEGDPKAQYILGTMYYNGFGVELNYETAFKWYEESAKQGNASAQFDLGKLYDYGLGIEKDEEKALEWFVKAAEQGNPDFQSYLGNLYRNEGDYEKALNWFEKAASQGDDYSQNTLGNMYFDGIGVEQDYEKALAWYKKAECNGGDATFGLGNIYREKGNMVKALEWYGKNFILNEGLSGDILVLGGLYRIKYILGVLYFSGEGVKQNYKKAFELLNGAVAETGTGCLGTYIYLGEMFYNGLGTRKNYKEAFKWWQKAARQDVDYAQFRIGLMYLEGQGVEQDYDEAIKYIMKAADQGYEDAVKLLEDIENG